MMTMEGAVWLAPESPIGVGWDLVTMKITEYDSHYFHTEQTMQWPLVSCMEASAFVLSLHSFIQVFPLIVVN